MFHKAQRSEVGFAVVAARDMKWAHTVVVLGHNVPSQDGVFSSDLADLCRYS